MSSRNAEQISWGEAARRGAGDIAFDVFPKTVLSTFISEGLLTVKRALNFNFSDWEIKTGVPAAINIGDYFLRVRNRYNLHRPSNLQAREATAVFEVSKMGMVVFNTWAMPAILNSPLPWEQKAAFIGGLAAIEYGLCVLQRRWGILPETTTPPTRR